MLKPTAIPCSKCGSKQTELRHTPPDGGFLNDLKNIMVSMARSSSQGGARFVVCKACGHVAYIHIR